MRRVHGFSGNVPASADHIRPGSPESGSAQTAQLGSAPRARDSAPPLYPCFGYARGLESRA
jgi:hypothetical protein